MYTGFSGLRGDFYRYRRFLYALHHNTKYWYEDENKIVIRIDKKEFAFIIWKKMKIQNHASKNEQRNQIMTMIDDFAEYILQDLHKYKSKQLITSKLAILIN